MSLPIIDRSARVQYTATAGQTSFVVPFEFFENSNLVVYRGTTQLTQSVTPTTADQYSVTGAGVEGGGTITLGAGATLGDVVTILRDVPVERLSDFPTSGPFQIEALNAELARIVTMVQQQETMLAGRVLRLADFDTPASLLTLPSAAERAGRVLAFNEAGAPAQGPDIAEVATLAASVSNIALVAGSIGDVNTVAGSMANVNTIAPQIGSIQVAATNIAAILAAPGYAADAANSALYAEAMTGPTYTSTAAGLTATTSGQGFAVDNGDGTFTVYRNEAGVAVAQRTVGTITYIDAAVAAAQAAQAGAESAEAGAGVAVADAVASAQANANLAVASAEGARDGAIAAKTAAETARDAAFVNASVYADVATGLAAVADGAQFMVVVGDEIIRYRRDPGPLSVEVARYASASKLANLPFEVESGPDLLRYVDLMGQVFYRIDANGEVYIPGQRQSIQDRLDAAPERDGGTIKGTDIAAVEDAAGNVVMRLKEDGSLVLPRIGNVQNALGAPLPGATIPRHTARHYLHSSISPLLSDLALQRIDYAPPPALLVPNNMGIPDTFVSAFTTSLPAPTPLNTPYRDNDRTVHPYLIEMPRPFCGYRYLMAQTPYSLTAHENPCIYGSNDLVNFELLPDMPQPLSSQEVGPYNFHSDNSFTYDPVNGELICAYRRTDDTTDKLLLRRTRDGQTWTPEEVYYVAPSGDGMLSPSLLYDPNTKLWNMWACRNQGWLTRYTAPDILGPWTKVSDQITSVNFGFTAWHLEVKFMGNKVVALVNQKETGANLFFGVSSDFDTWTFGPGLISPAQSGTYKGTFLPEFDGNNLTMVLAWNTNVTDTPANDKQFFITRTNTVNLSTL